MKNTNGMKTINTTEQNRTRRTRRTSERGTSLIEIMVVLVIILIGLFLAMRVFPIGFGILRANANRNTATQLAESMMSLVKGDAASVPNGVLFAATDPNGDPDTGLLFKTNINPDNLGPCYVDMVNGDPCSEDAKLGDTGNSYFADVNKFRFIKGETIKVPLPTPTAYGSGSLYTAKFGPLFMSEKVGDPTQAPSDPASLSYLKVYGAPLNGRVINNSQGLSVDNLVGLVRDEQTYLIDYGDDSTPAQILLPPRSAVAGRATPYREFSVTLTFVDETNSVVTRDVQFNVQPNTAPLITNRIDDDFVGWFPLMYKGTDNQYHPVVKAVVGSETVARDFTRLPIATAFDQSDPYQYKLVSSNIETGESVKHKTQANFGVIAFNPAGATASSGGTSSQQPFTAYLDYAVMDWHIIRDDRQVPVVLVGPGNTIPMRTTLQSIKRIGDSESDNTFYSGIYGPVAVPNTEANPKDFQVFALDEATGQPLVGGNYNSGNPAPADADYYLNYDSKGGSYKTGVIYLNASRIKAGTRLRILYKAEGDWAVSFQKAYAQYTPALEDDGTVSTLPKPGAFSNFAEMKTFNGNKIAAAQLRFPYSDLNKSVVVTLQYTVAGQNNLPPEVKRLAPVKITLEKFGTDPTADATKHDRKYAYVDVRDIIPFLQKSEFDDAIDWGVAGPVLGVSVKTRVIWHDNDTPNERWHVQDLDSYLKSTAVQ